MTWLAFVTGVWFGGSVGLLVGMLYVSHRWNASLDKPPERRK